MKYTYIVKKEFQDKLESYSLSPRHFYKMRFIVTGISNQDYTFRSKINNASYYIPIRWCRKVSCIQS